MMARISCDDYMKLKIKSRRIRKLHKRHRKTKNFVLMLSRKRNERNSYSNMLSNSYKLRLNNYKQV